MKKTQQGFTLIELLVVIAIIGLLSTLAVVALNSARQRSRDAKRVADIRQIQTALELGFSEVSKYPNSGGNNVVLGDTAKKLCSTSGTSAEVIWADSSGAVVTNGGTTGTTCGGTTFMGLVPSNPTPNGADYTYSSAAGADYSLTFTLEGATGQLSSGANCANPDGITAGTSC